ncbi:MAG: hypothetical protein ACHQK9_01755 [Reyranellales bacterium]
MFPMKKFAATLLAVAAIPAAAACAATLGGYNYAVQYDWSEFYQATYGKPFQVVFAGNPFPNIDAQDVARRMLPQMQANKPRSALTFTYDKPVEEPHPYYRLVLVFDSANDLNSVTACNGQPRFKAGNPGRVHVFAVYCRNELALSETTGWTDASSPDDPRVGELFKDLFAVVFTDSPALYQKSGRTPFN